MVVYQTRREEGVQKNATTAKEKARQKVQAVDGTLSFSVTQRARIVPFWALFSNSSDAKFVVQIGQPCYVRNAIVM